MTVRDLVTSARAGARAGKWIRPAHRRIDLDPVRVTWRALLAMTLVTPFVAFAVVVTVAALSDLNQQHAIGMPTLAVVIAVLLGGKLHLALHWLRRLDAAASFEEQALSAGPLSAGR